jgi:hypothetical protein
MHGSPRLTPSAFMPRANSHEAASRLHEAGWPLHHVQEMLGQSSLEQTSTYLNVQRGGLQETVRRSDAVPPRCNPVIASTQPVTTRRKSKAQKAIIN